MALHLLWGLALWGSISKYGLGVSTDAVHILFGAENFASGRGLISYDGNFLLLWPPLYPVLLAAVHAATGWGMLASALALQILAYMVLAASLSILFLRIFRSRFRYAIMVSLLAQLGSVMVLGFGMVGSDYLHLSLAMASAALLGSYLESGQPRSYVGLALICMLAALQRYVGVAVVATAALAIVVRGHGGLSRRILRGLIVASTSLPAIVWLALTSRHYDRRAALAFTENFAWFSRSLMEWFTGTNAAEGAATLGLAAFWLLMGLAIAATLFLSRPPQAVLRRNEADSESRVPSPYRLALLLYGLLYCIALFAAASLSYFNKLGGRFLLPLFVPIIALPVLIAYGLSMRVDTHRRGPWPSGLAAVSLAGLAAVAFVLLQTTVPLIRDSRAHGVASGDNAFNNSRWHDDPALIYWRSHEPSGTYSLYSNNADGVAFHTGRAVRSAPRSRRGPYADEEVPITYFESELFDQGDDVYLYWLADTTHDYHYTPEDLQQIAQVEALFLGETGSIYRLRPRPTG